jgi:hypothetical protein
MFKIAGSGFDWKIFTTNNVWNIGVTENVKKLAQVTLELMRLELVAYLSDGVPWLSFQHLPIVLDPL